MYQLNQLYSDNVNDLFSDYIEIGKQALENISEGDSPRVAMKQFSQDMFHQLIRKYSVFHDTVDDPRDIVSQIVGDLFVGTPRWSSPRLQYNVGTTVNEAAAATYALSLDANIYNINDGLAGNSLVAEPAVTNILAEMAGLSRAYGIFTYGGSATSLYGLRMGLKKACPGYSRSGLDSKEKVKVCIPEDAHFAHATAADWLGLGTENIIYVRTKRDRTTDVVDLEARMRAALHEGCKIGSIILNGGTTYDHAIDDIAAVFTMRNRLVKEFELSYKPHIHVDTVIGWIWLFFSGYRWKENSLNIDKATLAKLKVQHDRIKAVRYADSWGIDFHKSIGGCPIDCSMIMINDFQDAMRLSRKADGGSGLHQLAEDYSFVSPVDYTLENSRASGAPIAALTALHTLGKTGYQRNLANLVEQAGYIKRQLAKEPYIQVSNYESNGFAIFLRLMPPELPAISIGDEFLGDTHAVQQASILISEYTKKFFRWDYETRIRQNIGPEYSYTPAYGTTPNGTALAALKIYPVSPFFNRRYADETVRTIIRQRAIFNKGTWEPSRV